MPNAINRLIALFTQAFDALGAAVPIGRVEALAALLSRSMDHRGRAYHTSRHVIQLAAGQPPVAVLAALFHDLVYVQLDGGFPADRALSAYLSERLRGQPDGSFRLDLAAHPDDASLALAAGLFGLEDGQRLSPAGGVNEFASGLAALLLIGDLLPVAEQMSLLACIEATIPFRGANPLGEGLGDQLYRRWLAIARSHAPALTPDEARERVAVAVRFANADVAGFAEPEAAAFLADTWLLIVESNAGLAAESVFTVREYRQAVLRMANFLTSLNPEHVFHAYAGEPDAREMASLQAAARANLGFACRYLGAKQVSMAIVEALALLSGGDCPVALLLGHFGQGEYADTEAGRIEDFLPAVAQSADSDPLMAGVLADGRMDALGNNFIQSPYTAYCYRVLGETGVQYMLAQARRFFAGELTPEDYLAALPAGMAADVARACGAMAASRRPALLALAARFA